MNTLSNAQRVTLRSYASDGEAPDYAEFADRAGPALGWLNRERVIDALIRKGLLTRDQKLTDAGREALEPIAQCQNCDWRGPVSKVLPDIPHYHERVEPGEPTPEGECPKCRALCHLVEKIG